MIETVRKYIENEKLLQPNANVIVGLSGGADSMALIDILKQLGHHCMAAHCNFHLRGPESDRDASFVKEWCANNNIPLLSVDFDTYRHAKEHKLSIEMAARELRYSWFETIRQEQKAEAIAVAHHRDDSVETVLLNLVRGTGIRGLTGISPKNGYIIRPLLSVSRADIEEYIAKRSIPYVTDSTNHQELYVRNLIRLRILPDLEIINPKAKEAIHRTSLNLVEVEKLYSQSIKEIQSTLWKHHMVNDANGKIDNNKNNAINIKALLESVSPKAVLFELLSPLGFSPSTINDILESLHGEPGRQFFGGSYRLIKDRELLILDLLKEESAVQDLFLINERVNRIDYPMKLTLNTEEMPVTIRKESHILYIDADSVKFPLTLRKWQHGDWFIPLGMKGKKKLSDFFVDNKFSIKEKENAWLLLSDDQVVWLVGIRSDNRFRVTEATRRVLVIELSY